MPIEEKVDKYLNEKSEKYIEKIKKYLVNSENARNWKEFVDKQEIGDCQWIVNSIIRNFSKAKKVVGEMETDEPYIDENGEYQSKIIHHWIRIGRNEYDFAKGTLKNYIDFDDLYDVGKEQ